MKLISIVTSHLLIFCSNFRCDRVRGSMQKGETRDIICVQPVRGHLVFVVLNGRNYLTLCEVEVMAVKGKLLSHTSDLLMNV